MKLDPGMHIVMHLVFFGKTGVTGSWLSIAGASCVLTGVGAGEEQARKVVAGEASRCEKDK
jgi:hypothetical protein